MNWLPRQQGVPRNTQNDVANVRVAFKAFTKFLTSNEASPYSEKERKSAAFKHLKAAFEPGGALYNDILDANLNIKQKFEATADTLPNFLTQLMGYGKSVEQSVQNGHSDSAKNALSQFPMLDSNQYLCVPGTSIKMQAASRLLAQNPAQIAVVAGYNQSVLPLLISANETVFEDAKVHSESAIAYLMGVPKDIIAQVDSNYRVPLNDIKLSSVWPTIIETLSIGHKATEHIQVAMQEIANDESPIGNIWTNSSLNNFFKPWEIDRDKLLKPFYDEYFQPILEETSTDQGTETESIEAFTERVINRVEKEVFDSINRQLSGDTTVDWASLKQAPSVNIPTINDLSYRFGKEWFSRQITSITDNDCLIDTLEQEAAILGLLACSEKLQGNKPIIVIDTLYYKGGGGLNGLRNGKTILEHIADANPRLEPVITTMLDNISRVCNFSGEVNGELGMFDYTNYLLSDKMHSTLNLLNVMIKGGAATEDIVREIRRKTVSELNYEGAHHMPPIATAMDEGRADLVDIFCQKDMSLARSLDASGNNALGFFTENGHVEQAKRLFSWYESNDGHKLMDEHNIRGENACHVAARSGHKSLLTWYCDRQPRLAYIYDGNQSTVVDIRLAQGDTETADRIHQQDPEWIDEENNQKQSRMHVAVINDRFETFKWLYAKESSMIDSTDIYDKQPMDIAVEQGRLNFFNFVYQSMEDDESKQDFIVGKDSKSYTNMHRAVTYAQREFITYLDENESDLIGVPNEDGELPLHIAAEYGNSDVFHQVFELTDSASDPGLVSEKNNQGETPMMTAVIYNRLEDVEWMNQKNSTLIADVDNNGHNMMH